MQEVERSAQPSASSRPGVDVPLLFGWVSRSRILVALAGRFDRWVGGHPSFDAAMAQGRPVEALHALIRGWAKMARANRAALGRPAPSPIGFPQQHSGRVVVIGEGTTQPLKMSVLRHAQSVIVDYRQGWLAHDKAVEMAAAGVPLVSGAVSLSVPGGGGVTPTELVDVRIRELQSIRLRRCALEVLRGASPEPTSVVLATRRATDLPSALEMIARQRHPPLEVLIGLHGDGFEETVEARLAGAGRHFHRYGQDLNLGQVLQDLTRRSRGDLIVKWDDDDWYGRNHLGDLAMALRYSDADLVGKAAEFVFLEDLGVTLRRMSVGAESFSSTLAGGALMLTRDALDRAGGWPPIARHVDVGLIARMKAVGGSVYRTHGFEYVLRRSRGGHTWTADSSYFVAQSVEQRSGLDLSFAGFDDD